MLDKKPKVITLYNLKAFFDFKSISTGGIRPGMLVSFSYRSPDGVHDTKPFVYILENQNQRIVGLNLHYNYQIVKFLIEQKDDEIANFLKNSPEYKKQLNILSKPTTEDLGETETVSSVSSVATIKDNTGKKEVKPEDSIDLKKIRISSLLLESYVYKEKSDSLIRTYLFQRMSSVYKMSYRYF